MWKTWRFWLGVVISVLFLAYAIKGQKLPEVWQGLREANYLWLIPGIIVYFGAVWLRTYRWKYLLRPIKSIPVRTSYARMDIALEKVATVLQSYPTSACTVEGHTDSVGNDRYNQALSERRADAVKNWLAAHGVTSRMSTRGWGKTKPVAPNTYPNGKDNPEGRQKNRRVEIVVKTG